MSNSNKVSIVSCKFSGLKLVGYQDFIGLIEPNSHHPLFDVPVKKLSYYLGKSENNQPSEKEQYLIGLYPAVWTNNNFVMPMDLDSTQVFTLFSKARILIHRLAKLEKTNEALRESIKKTKGYRDADQHNKNILIQRADLIKEFFQSIPAVRITSDNYRDEKCLINYYTILISIVNGLLNSGEIQNELTVEQRLTITNEELDRIVRRKEMLVSGNYKLRDQHFSFLAIELGVYIAAQSGKQVDTNEIALMIKGFFTCEPTKLDRAKFMNFARIAKEVLSNSSDSISQAADDIDFIVRKIEQIESDLNSLQGLIGGELFEINKPVNGVEYKIIQVTENTDEVFKDTLQQSIAGSALASKLAEIKARLKR